MDFFGIEQADGLVRIPGPFTMEGTVTMTGPVSAPHLDYTEVDGLQDALDAKLDAASYTAADVLSKLLTVDGAGSGLDADLLDGLSSAAFLSAASYTAADVLAKLLTVDGSGSGLDADLLDGISSAGFLQTSTYEALTPTWANLHTFSTTPAVPNQSWTYAKLQNVSATSRVLGRITAGAGTIEELTGANLATIMGYTAADVLSKLLTVDGSGSGLDADLLDGINSTAFALLAGATFTGSVITPAGSLQLSGSTRVVTAGDGTNNMQLVCDAATANTRDLIYRTAGSNRWLFRANATAESGSNAGCDFEILRRTDAGGSLGTALRIVRSSGQWLFEDGAVGAPEIAFQTSPTSGAYLIGSNNIGIACNGTLVLSLATGTTALTCTTLRLNVTTATTVGAAGGATALPATPLGYLAANVNGTAVKIPYYNN